MDFDINSAQPVSSPFADPPTSTFDINSASPLNMPNEKIYSERTNELIEAPYGTIDRLIDISTRGFNKGDAETQIGQLGFEQFMGNDTPFIRAEIERLHEEAGGAIRTRNFVEEGFRASSQQLPVLKEIIGNVAKRGMQGGIGFGTVGLSFAGVGAVPGFFAGISAGSLTGLVEQSFILETGHLYREISQFKDNEGNTINPLAARITAAVGGAASAGLEAVPVALLFRLVPGSKKLFQNVSKDQIKKIKSLKIPTGKGALRTFAINVSTIIAAETATEGAQELVQIAAGEVAKLTSDLDIPPITANEALDRVGNAMTEALKATPLIATGFSVPQLTVDTAKAIKTKRDIAQAKRDAVLDTKIEKIKNVSSETVDTVTEKLRSAPVSEDLKTYKVGVLDQQEQTELKEAGIEVATNGTIIATDAELIAAESMRRTDFYKRQLNQQTKDTATAETVALRTVARSRIRKIDNVIKDFDQKIDDTLTIIDERKAQGKPVKNLDNRINSLLKKREILDEERASLLTQGTGLGTARAALQATDKQIELKGSELLRAERRVAVARDRALQKGIREGIRLAKTDIKAAQKTVLETIKQSDLNQNDKGKFLAVITNIQSAAQLQKILPQVLNRIDRLVTSARRKKVITKLQKTLARTKIKNNRSPFGPQVQAILDVARKAIQMSKKDAITEFEKNANDGTTKIPTPTQALRNKLLAIKVDPQSVDVVNLEKLLESFTQLMDLGKSVRGNDILAKQKASEKLRTELSELIGPLRTETDKQQARREKLLAVETEFFLGMSGAWWNKVKRTMRSSDKTRVDAMTNALSLFKESRNFDRGKTNSVKRFTELMLAAMNTTSERALLKKLQEDETVQLNLGSFVHSDGKTRLLKVKTRAQLRKRIMELSDPVLRESMMSEKGNKYTEEIITALELEMTELDYRMVKAQLQFYEEYYQRINEVYERVYGYTLPKIENYSPIRRVFSDEKQHDEFMKSIIYRGGVAPSSLKSRKPNVRPIKEIGDLTVLQSHISEMEYFIAYSEKTQQLNEIFNSEIREQIEEVHSKDLFNSLQKDLDAFSKRGVENSITGESVYLTLMRNFTFAQLGAKPQIGLKQLASFAAFAEDVKTKDFIEGIVVFAKNPRKALQELNQSEFFATRGSNIDRDYEALLSDKSFLNFVGKRPSLAKVLMLPIKYGDKSAIAIGGYAHYYAMLKKNGGNKKAALSSFEMLSVRTQQSADVDQLSELQRSNSFVRILTQFMSSANALARAEYNAIIDKTAGRIDKKEFSKRMLVLHVIIPGLIQFIANGFKWDDEDQLRASILGSLNGIFIIGELFDVLARVAVGGRDAVIPLENRSPIAFISDFALALADFAENGIEYEDVLDGTKAIDRMTKVTGDLTGVPVKTLVGQLRGVYHISQGVAYGNEDYLERGVYEALGYSSYSIDKKILAD